MSFQSLQSTGIQLEPGVRMVAGKPYVFDGELRGDHRAVEAVRNAPADLAGLSDDGLKALERATWRASYTAAARNDPALWTLNETLRSRVWAELTGRGFATDGTRDPQADVRAAA
jgi:hypothetical protein